MDITDETYGRGITCVKCADRMLYVAFRGYTLNEASKAGFDCGAPGYNEAGHKIMGHFGVPVKLCEAQVNENLR